MSAHRTQRCIHPPNDVHVYSSVVKTRVQVHAVVRGPVVVLLKDLFSGVLPVGAREVEARHVDQIGVGP